MKRGISFNFPAHFYFLFLLFFAQAQVKHGDTLEFKEVYDDAYGINIYEALNMNIGGDSVRCDGKGYALQGWVEDYYPDKQVLHKGYYIDGQLKAYKNFFQNGQLEREFKMTDLNKSAMIIYYQDGKLRSNIVYADGNALKEEDYYPTGQLEYIEENNKKAGCYIQRKFYAQNGETNFFAGNYRPKKKNLLQQGILRQWKYQRRRTSNL